MNKSAISILRLFTCTFLLLATFSTSLIAQKFGHINSQKFIAEMPAAKQIDKELITYRNELVAATDKLQVALDEKAKVFEKDYTDGIFSDKVAQEKYAALEQEQQGIFQRRKDDEQRMLKRREGLFSPLFERVEEGIKAVGKEQAFTFIFDSSYYNAIIYTESEDVTEAVKAWLSK